MDTTNPQWDDLRVLLAVHEAGSFLAAAKRLGVSPSTVARRVEVLESSLGYQVVRRSTDGATFEPAANELLRIALRTRDELSVATRDAASAQGVSSMRGIVRVSLGSGFLPFVAQVVTNFRQTYPETDFELTVENRSVDLTRREADVGLRTASVEAQGVVCRRAGILRYGFYASSGYAASHDALSAGLGEHDVIGLEGPLSRDASMQWLHGQGVKHFAVKASGAEVMIHLAQCGAGVALLPHILATKHAGLVRLDWQGAAPPDKSAFVAYHADLKTVPRVRKFTDAMTEALRVACLSGK